ncbi:MAG: hypothetical protein QXL54_05155 [Candidatus Bathyarchaeia archaeon]
MRKRLLHHGLCSGEFSPRYVGTDYFTFYHVPCFRKGLEHYGHCDVTAVLIDNDGRIIFNLKCKDCGAVDALKTHPLLWHQKCESRNTLTRFHLSPKLKTRIRRHWWDNR